MKEPTISAHTTTEPAASRFTGREQTVAQPAPWSTPGKWTINAGTGSAVSGYLPAWAEDDPSENAVPADLMPARLVGINHRTFFEGQMMPLIPTGSRGEAEEDAVLEGSIDCNPYDPEPGLRRPHVTVQVCVGYWIRGLDPDGLIRIVAQLRAQADRLDHEILPALIAAREDWAARGQGGPDDAHA